MAIVYSGMQCALCDKVIEDALLESNDYVATSAFIDDVNHHLWPFSDATMHKECFVAWEHRDEFMRLYNDLEWHESIGSGSYYRLEPDGTFVRLRRNP
jgi:hypothetical protein